MKAIIDFINDLVARFVFFISGLASSFFENLNIAQYSPLQVAIDILLIAFIFYWIIMLIRGTRATNIILGLLILASLFLVSRALQLLAVSWFLDKFLTVILVAIPIIFQQELRRGLEKLGKTKFFLAERAKEIDLVMSELIDVSFSLAKKRLGALIVLRREVSLKEYIDTGIPLDAKLSKELLLSLFSEGSPLHDGAAIIEDYRMKAAGCVLPHAFKNYGHSFGTRHKAALGLSEVTDAKVIVVSEQRGTVSFVSQGEMELDITPERLHEFLSKIFHPKRKFRKKLYAQESPL